MYHSDIEPTKVSPVSLLFPQSDLVSDGGRDLGGHLVGGHHVHVEESDDLVGCDAPPEVRVTAVYNYCWVGSPESLTTGVPGNDANTEVWKPVENLSEQTKQGNL